MAAPIDDFAPRPGGDEGGPRTLAEWVGFGLLLFLVVGLMALLTGVLGIL